MARLRISDVKREASSGGEGVVDDRLLLFGKDAEEEEGVGVGDQSVSIRENPAASEPRPPEEC